MEIKKMAFAGTWYPSTAAACESSIRSFLGKGQCVTKADIKGGIVPHAGWHYSGSIACRVIASMASQTRVDTVILFGAHMRKQSEPFILSHGCLETPFGEIEADVGLVEKICVGVRIRKKFAACFPDENTLELQYPFIRYFFPDSKIVVCGAPPSNFASIIGSRVVNAANTLGRTIKVIGSTDMTHYGPDFGLTSAGTGEDAVAWVARKNDRAAIEALKEMDEQKIISQGLKHKNMCCPGAAAATASASKKMGAAKAIELDYATSFERNASTSFVGYCGILYAFF